MSEQILKISFAKQNLFGIPKSNFNTIHFKTAAPSDVYLLEILKRKRIRRMQSEYYNTIAKRGNITYPIILHAD